MKKNLLTVSSNLFNKFQQKPLRFLVSLVLVFVLGSSTKTVAQCSGYNYVIFESFKSFAASGTFAAPGVMPGYNQPSGTDVWRQNTTANVAGGYSGSSALRLTSYTSASSYSYFISPKITTAGSLTLSFYSRLVSGSTTTTVIAEYSTNYSGSGDPTAGGVTWTQIGTTLSVSSSASYVAFGPSSFTPGADCYIRIRRASSGSIPQIDDFGVSSSVPSENKQIVLPTQTSAGATSCTTVAMPLNGSYVFSDNGGLSDNYNNGVVQDHTVTFTPFPGQRIQISFPSTTSAYPLTQVPTNKAYDVFTTPTGSLTISNTDNTITNYTTNSAPATIYTSVAAGCTGVATIRFVTNAGTTGNGFALTVSSIAPASCSNVTGLGVTSANITTSSVPLTWTALTGCSAPASGYDYYYSISSSPPTGSTTPSGNDPNPASTGTTVTGLSGNTTYYMWVRTDCGVGTYGSWVAIPGSTITTVCTPQNVTYTEDFQGSATVLPTCTSSTSGASGIANYSGNYVFYNSTTGTSFFTQPINLDSTKIYRLSYDYGNSLNVASTFQIYYGSTAYAATTSNINTSIVASVTGSSTTLTTGRYYFQPPTTGVYYIRFALNSNAGGNFLLDNIEVKQVPCYPAATPTSLSGPVNPCAASSQTYTVSTTVTAPFNTPDSYTFTAPSGWLITGTSGNTVTVTTGAIPGNISVVSNYTGCDSSLPVNFPVSTSAPPAQPSVISGTTTICAALPVTGLTYSVTNVPGTVYNWSFPSGWNQTAGGTTNSVTYTASGSAVSGTITVTPQVGTCNGTPRTLNVVVGSVPNSVCSSAVSITSTASDTFRCSTRHFWYSFTPPCAGDYKVNLSGSGGDIDVYAYSGATYTCGSSNPGSLSTNSIATGVTGSATESVTLTGLSTSTTYYILVYDFSNGSGGTFNLSVLSTTLSTIGTISGSSSVSCSSVTTTIYTVPAVTGASSYIWTLPAGWSGASSTNSITVTTNGTTGGTISVVASGACGTTTAATKTIAVGQVQPGTISGSTNLCSPFSATTYSVAAVVGATSYTWSLPGGWSGTSTTTSISIIPNATSGTISVAANGPCGTSAATTLAITTTAAVVTTNATICAGDSASLSSTISGVTTFSMNDIPVGAPTFVRPISSATAFSSSGTTAIYGSIAIIPSVTGSYTFNGCDGSGKDTFMVIYDGSFNPLSPGTNFLSANDDSNSSASCNVDPRITLPLIAGQTYIIVYTAFYGTTGFSAITSLTGITISVTPPAGGLIQVGTTDWYTASSGGSPIFSANSFNPVGVPGSGLSDTLTPGIYTYYATNSQASYCRTATTFTISAAPTQSITPASSTVCPNSVNAVSANATGTGVTTTWSSNVANTLYSNAQGTTAYVAGTNAATIYVKSTAAVTVTAQSTVGTCSVTSSVTFSMAASKTWDGSSWSPSAPGINDAIIINNGWASGDLQGCSCTVNSGLVNFYTGQTLTLTNELTVLGGTVTFNDESSLYQTSTVANTAGSYSGGNSGNITYNRTAQPMFKYDYTYWSSPVYNQNLLAMSPSSPQPFFYQYNYTSQAWQYINPVSNPMEVARGYAIRAPLSFPIFPGSPLDFTGIFTGIPNNGTITYPITTGSSQLNLIGNPYASAIYANDFISLAANNNISGTLYFWTHNTYISNTGQYVQSDYASYNLSGGVRSGPSGTGNFSIPLGYVASGQGFFVRGISGAPNGSAPYSVTFTNSMRRAATNNRTNFFKNNQSMDSNGDYEKDRFWLNIANADGGFKQTLIGYIENATDGIDRLYDGEFIDVGNTLAIYSVMNTNLLSIQGRQLPFNINDLVPVGYKSLTSGNCTISMDSFDSFFTNQDIFIEDKLLGVIHNLKEAAYVFSTDAGTFNDRFVIRYTSETLGTPDTIFNQNSVRVYKNESGLHINTGAVMMRSVKIFDIRGRLLASREGINAATSSFTSLPTTQQVLLVQITSETGVIVTKKVVY